MSPRSTLSSACRPGRRICPFLLPLAKPLVLALAAAGFAARAQAPAPPAPAPVAAEEADRLVEAAREAARRDRNREAADLFGRAIERAPQRRRELLREYADQLTYSSRAAQAVPLYREALASAAPGAARRGVLKGLGLALLWSDEPGAARGVYEELLRDDPADRDARRNLARALSWGGRQRDAARVLRELLQAHPDDAEARVQLAQAEAWMGRPDRARATLDAAGTTEREDARRLRAELERAAAPRTRAELQRSTQSDDLDIGLARLGHEIPFDGGRGLLGARLDALEFEREDGSDTVRATRPLLRGRYRFSDALEWNAELGEERLRPRGGPSFGRLVYATWLTLWPGDRLRLDLSSSRSTFDNLRSLRLGLTARQHGLSMDLTPDERQRYTVRLERGLYSDGNRRWSGQLEGEYRWRTHPQAWAGLRHVRLRFARQLDNGYFNPKDFRATQLTARVSHRFGGDAGRWDLSAQAALGREHADPDGSKPTYDLGLQAGWRLDARTRLEARVQRFSSRTAALSGFARTTVGVALERGW